MKLQNNRKKICLISSSGGHYEQLKMLAPLGERYDIFWITEKTKYVSNADYYLTQTGSNDKFFIFKMIINMFTALRIWFKERPDFVVTTGTLITLPMLFLAKLFRKKIVFIETFAIVYDSTKAGRLMYKFADLFIVQWETLKKVYPNAVYGGGIY